MLEKIEGLKKIQKRNKEEVSEKDIENIDHDNFPPLKEFLKELEQKESKQIKSKYKELFLKSRVSPEQECCSNAAPKLVVLPDKKNLLMLYRVNDNHTDSYWCDSDLYSIDGTFTQKVPFCPDYYIKDKPQLLVRADYTGCCGAFAWDFGVVSTETKQSLIFECGDSDCRDVFLSWLPRHRR